MGLVRWKSVALAAVCARCAGKPTMTQSLSSFMLPYLQAYTWCCTTKRIAADNKHGAPSSRPMLWPRLTVSYPGDSSGGPQNDYFRKGPGSPKHHYLISVSSFPSSLEIVLWTMGRSAWVIDTCNRGLSWPDAGVVLGLASRTRTK